MQGPDHRRSVELDQIAHPIFEIKADDRERKLLGGSDRESAVNADDSVTAKGTYILKIGFMGRRELLENTRN